jgi:hypothetical protein
MQPKAKPAASAKENISAIEFIDAYASIIGNFY